jgi:hypothetical protein
MIFGAGVISAAAVGRDRLGVVGRYVSGTDVTVIFAFSVKWADHGWIPFRELRIVP